ncbi:hypothetical protein FOZ63_015046, partial [Perkinsus olseni]
GISQLPGGHRLWWMRRLLGLELRYLPSRSLIPARRLPTARASGPEAQRTLLDLWEFKRRLCVKESGLSRRPMMTASHETEAYNRYSVMRVGVLRALCKEKGLPSDGRKEDLVNRLCNNCSSSSYSGLINASTSSIIGGPSAGPATSKPSTDVTTSDGVLSEGGITTPHESSGEGDGSSSSHLTTTELHELASIADEIRHIRKQTEFSLLRVAGIITDYPPSCLASDSRYGGAPKSTP